MDSRRPSAAGSPLGERIRARRRDRGLTLTEVARLAGLSHPFLSQVERGRAQPSMSSLFRIAGALGVTQDWLLAAGATEGTDPVAMRRRGEGDAVSMAAPMTGGGHARQLLAQPGRFVPTEFTGVGRIFGEFFAHAGSEYLYLADGHLDVELELGDGALHRLGPGDCLRYPGAVPHRWRAADDGPTRVIMIHTDLPGPAGPDRPDRTAH